MPPYAVRGDRRPSSSSSSLRSWRYHPKSALFDHSATAASGVWPSRHHYHTPRSLRSLPQDTDDAAAASVTSVDATVASKALLTAFPMAPPEWHWTQGSNPCEGFTTQSSVCCATAAFSSYLGEYIHVPQCSLPTVRPCPWKYVTCKGGHPIALTVRGSSLQGTHGLDLTTLSEVNSLQRLYVWENYDLTGPLTIPDSMTDLVEIDVSYTNMSVDVTKIWNLKTNQYPSISLAYLIANEGQYGNFEASDAYVPPVEFYMIAPPWNEEAKQRVTGTIKIDSIPPEFPLLALAHMPQLTLDISYEPTKMFENLTYILLNNISLHTGQEVSYGKPHQFSHPDFKWNASTVELHDVHFRMRNGELEQDVDIPDFDFGALKNGTDATLEWLSITSRTGKTVDWGGLVDVWKVIDASDQLVTLTGIQLQGNFTGNIDLSALFPGNVTLVPPSYTALYLSDNKWDSQALEWGALANAPNLAELYLSKSNLTGSMDGKWQYFPDPTWPGSSFYRTIDLSHNQLTGDCDFKGLKTTNDGWWSIREFNIRNNSFSCSKTSSFFWALFDKVLIMDISHNKFSGLVQWDTVAAHAKNTFSYIDIAFNQFFGNVAWEEIRNDTQSLLINDNNFSGTVQLDVLRKYRQIDLSNNYFEGTVTLKHLDTHDQQLFSLNIKQYNESALCFDEYVDLTPYGWYNQMTIDWEHPYILDPEMMKETDLTDEFIKSHPCNPTGTPAGDSKSKLSLGVIIALIVGVLLLCFLCVLGFVMLQRKRSRGTGQAAEDNDGDRSVELYEQAREQVQYENADYAESTHQ